VKFDYRPDEAPLEIAPQLEAMIGDRKVVVLGSTMEGEDEDLLPEIEGLLAQQRAFVIIAPRKPERFEMVAGLLATSQLRFVRRSEMRPEGAGTSSCSTHLPFGSPQDLPLRNAAHRRTLC
jgi:3-deoxy-D-manno-octulosonic-acid transferase